MVLRNLLEQLLPASESGSFGTGPSAGVWRSIAADQLANVYAQGGGLGISSMLEAHDQPVSKEVVGEQWPYFSATAIRAFTG